MGVAHSSSDAPLIPMRLLSDLGLVTSRAASPMASNGAESEPLLSVKHLSCSRSGKEIFTDVSFNVHAGDVVVLTGKSGSGKSTLLKCLAHLTVYGGEVLFRGQ